MRFDFDGARHDRPRLARPARRWGARLGVVAVAIMVSWRPGLLAPMTAESSARWWKGNTHTHTLWSDGDDFPEMAADWYKQQGYHFLSITDHNTLATEEQWWPVPANGIGREAYEKYRARFGAWVDERRSGDSVSVRLKRPSEYASRFNERGRFLLIPGEEITQYLERRGAHMNALNVAEVIPAQHGVTLVEMLRRDLDAVREQERRTGREINAVLNHPNFLWSQTAEDLLELPALRFFEVYNGHPLVNLQGDAVHASTERIWDIVLTHRFSSGGGPLYGVGTDDTHDYHHVGSDMRNGGRGWIVVRASQLNADSLMAAMRRGDFYASSGVELTNLRRDGHQLSLTIKGAPGLTYTTQFIGTRRGWDTTSAVVRDSTGRAVTRRYSADVGAVLAEVGGTSPSYTMRGDELYVRARVVSSRRKPNAAYAGELETAWAQPVRP